MARDHNYTWPATTRRTGRPMWKQFVAMRRNAGTRPVGRMHAHLADARGRRDLRQHEPGAVAALTTDTGRPQWIVRYPREEGRSEPTRHALLSRPDAVLVRSRPTDRGPGRQRKRLAYDAATGLLLWETSLAKDVVHLLGVGGDALWASGEKLWHINVATGKVSYPWPEGPTPKGFGRGVLAGGKVYWPTVRAIHVFDQRTGQEQAPIQLEARGLHSGNLIAAGEVLLITGNDRITALGPAGLSAPTARSAAHGNRTRDGTVENRNRTGKWQRRMRPSAAQSDE